MNSLPGVRSFAVGVMPANFPTDWLHNKKELWIPRRNRIIFHWTMEVWWAKWLEMLQVLWENKLLSSFIQVKTGIFTGATHEPKMKASSKVARFSTAQNHTWTLEPLATLITVTWWKGCFGSDQSPEWEANGELRGYHYVPTHMFRWFWNVLNDVSNEWHVEGMTDKRQY